MIIAQVIMTIIQLGDRIIGSIYIGTDTLQIVTIVFPILSIGMVVMLLSFLVVLSPPMYPYNYPDIQIIKQYRSS